MFYLMKLETGKIANRETRVVGTLPSIDKRADILLSVLAPNGLDAYINDILAEQQSLRQSKGGEP